MAAQTDQLVKLSARAVVELITANLTFIHELTKFLHFFFLLKILRLAGLLKVTDSFALSENMHGTFVQEELSILSPNFLNVRHIADELEAIINVRFRFDLRRGVATRAQLLTYEREHAFFGHWSSLVQTRFKLLESLHRCLEEVVRQTATESQHGDGEAALNNALVVSCADCEHLG